jgi:hypothetical protein
MLHASLVTQNMGGYGGPKYDKVKIKGAKGRPRENVFCNYGHI